MSVEAHNPAHDFAKPSDFHAHKEIAVFIFLEENMVPIAGYLERTKITGKTVITDEAKIVTDAVRVFDDQASMNEKFKLWSIFKGGFW